MPPIDRVIGIDCAAGIDDVRVARDVAGGRGGGGDRGRRRQAGRGIAVDEPRIRRRQSRKGGAIDLRLIIRRDRQRSRRDSQIAGKVADRIIGIDCAAGCDGVGAARDVAGGCGGGRDRGRRGQAGRGIAVDEPRIRRGEGRQRIAVNLGLVVRGDRERGRGDGQATGNVADRVVGIDRAARRDGVGAARDMAGGGGSGSWDRGAPWSGSAGGLAVDEPRIRRGEVRQERSP